MLWRHAAFRLPFDSDPNPFRRIYRIVFIDSDYPRIYPGANGPSAFVLAVPRTTPDTALKLHGLGNDQVSYDVKNVDFQGVLVRVDEGRPGGGADDRVIVRPRCKGVFRYMYVPFGGRRCNVEDHAIVERIALHIAGHIAYR